MNKYNLDDTLYLLVDGLIKRVTVTTIAIHAKTIRYRFHEILGQYYEHRLFKSSEALIDNLKKQIEGLE